MPEFSFETALNQETEFRKPPEFDESLQQPVIIDPKQPGSSFDEPEPERQPGVDPKVQAAAYISLFDSVNYGAFLMLLQSKLRRKYFDNEAEFQLAEEYIRKTTGELAKMEDPEKAMNLVERYRKYNTRIDARKERIPFTMDEKMQLEKPLTEMIRLNPGFDLPPGAALVFAAVGIIIPRVIMLKEDI